MKRVSWICVLSLGVAACGSHNSVEDKDEVSACDGLSDGEPCDLGGGLCLEITRRSSPECEEDPGVCLNGLCVPIDEWEDPNDPGDDPDDPGDPNDPDDPGDDPNDPDDPPLCEEDTCDDGNECTVGGCEDDECVFTPVQDGESCGDGGRCQAGECVLPTPPEAPDPITVERDLYCKLGLLPIKVPMTLTVTPKAPFVTGQPTEISTEVTAELSEWVAKLAIKAHKHKKAKVKLREAYAEIDAKGTEERAIEQSFKGLPMEIKFEDRRGRPKVNVIESGALTQVVTPEEQATEVAFKLDDAGALITNVPHFDEIEIPSTLHCYMGHGEKARFDVTHTNE